MPRFPGVLPAVTTPFAAGGEIDLAGLRRNVDGLLAAGMTGIVGTGTMGEAGSLTREERAAVLHALVDAVDGRVPVVAGISAATAAEAAAHAAAARAAGAAGAMCLPPLGYRADADETVAFFAEVGAATPLPLMLYNNPEASGVDLPAALVARIAAEVETVVAVKECSGDARRIAAVLAAAPPRVEVLVGGDDWPLEGLCAGATGWVSGVAVVAPVECRELFAACAAGDLAAARALNRRLLPLARFDMTPKLVQYFKAAQDAVGRVGGPVRPPRRPLSPDERAALAAALAALAPTAAAPATAA